MRHHRINFLGASGSGASTAGRAVADALSIPYFDGDDFFHGPSVPPFNSPRSPRDRLALITAALGTSRSWVLGGGVAGWDPYPELEFTQIVFLWVPTKPRVERLRRREQHTFRERVLPGGDMYEQHEAFVSWASGYDAGNVEGKTLHRHEAYLARQTCPVLEMRGLKDAQEVADAVLSAIRPSSR